MAAGVLVLPVSGRRPVGRQRDPHSTPQRGRRILHTQLLRRPVLLDVSSHTHAALSITDGGSKFLGGPITRAMVGAYLPKSPAVAV